MKLLVENGIDINQCGENGFSPLKVAAEFASAKVAEYLIAHGADPSALDAEELYDAAKHRLHLQRLSQQIESLTAQVAEHCSGSTQQTVPEDAFKATRSER